VQRLYGDEQLAHEVFEVFVDECASLLDEMRQAMAQRDVDSIRRAAHTLTGAADSAGARAAADAARTLEALVRDGHLDGLDAAWTRVSDEVAAVMRLYGPVSATRKDA